MNKAEKKYFNIFQNTLRFRNDQLANLEVILLQNDGHVYLKKSSKCGTTDCCLLFSLMGPRNL